MNAGDVAEMAIKQERARWVEWLADVGYGIDFTHHPHPPCSPREVAEVYAERDPIAACDLVGSETSTEVHEWVIAQNTGWEQRQPAPEPSPAEQQEIDRFGIFAEEEGW